MLKARVIPCLDVKDGRTVKGVNFVDLVDAGDPVEQARIYDEQGADELCFLDIAASHENRDTLFGVVNRTAEQCFMPLTVGGGVSMLNTWSRLAVRSKRYTPLDSQRWDHLASSPSTVGRSGTCVMCGKATGALRRRPSPGGSRPRDVSQRRAGLSQNCHENAMILTSV